MAETDSWDADEFEPEEPVRKAGTVSARDRWEGEDEEEDVKDNWDDEEEAENKAEPPKTEPKVSDKKKLNEKIKEKENALRQKQEELKNRIEEPEFVNLSPEEQLAEKLRLKKLEEDSDLELAKEAFGEASVVGIDAMNPSSRDDFTEFGKLLKEKITQYDKSLYYPVFLEALFREVCISLEVEDLKKITSTLTVLCSEKQKQEKQSKAKKKKKGVVPGGGLKANMKDDLANYGGLEEYGREFEDFM